MILNKGSSPWRLRLWKRVAASYNDIITYLTIQRFYWKELYWRNLSLIAVLTLLFFISGIHFLHDSCICHLLLLKNHLCVLAIMRIIWALLSDNFMGLHDLLPLLIFYSLDINFYINCWECSAVHCFCLLVCSKKWITKLLNAVLWFSSSMPIGLFMNFNFITLQANVNAYVNEKVSHICFICLI